MKKLQILLFAAFICAAVLVFHNDWEKHRPAQPDTFTPYSVVWDPVNQRYGAVNKDGHAGYWCADYEQTTWMVRLWQTRDAQRAQDESARPTQVLPRIVYVTNEVQHVTEVYHTNEVYTIVTGTNYGIQFDVTPMTNSFRYLSGKVTNNLSYQ